MNERERLIELLLQTEAFTPDCEEQARKQAEYKANKLLANGIIVPPCKVGDKIYMLVTKNTISYETKNHIMTQHKNQHTFIKQTYLMESNFFRVIKDFGKTVFLSREDAEKALKERESK